MLGAWFFFAAIAYAAIYTWAFPDALYLGERIAPGESPFLVNLYDSVVTLTTLGFGDIVAQNPTGRLLVISQVILGYVMLGLLVSVLADKVARRS